MTDEELRDILPALRPKLLDLACRYVKDGDEAEDIVQDAMLKLWVVRDRLIGPTEGFAMAVVRNFLTTPTARRPRNSCASSAPCPSGSRPS